MCLVQYEGLGIGPWLILPSSVLGICYDLDQDGEWMDETHSIAQLKDQIICADLLN